MSDVKEHVEQRTLHEIVITPEHAQRTESSEFRATKERLRTDGHYRCWVCGTTEDLQVHHFGIEWSLAGIANWDRVKTFVEEWDPYGYGRLLNRQPMTSADDIRNMLVLCREHHTGVDHADNDSGTGIHNLSFPVWVSQKLAAMDPVPQTGETKEQTMSDVKENSHG